MEAGCLVRLTTIFCIVLFCTSGIHIQGKEAIVHIWMYESLESLLAIRYESAGWLKVPGSDNGDLGDLLV